MARVFARSVYIKELIMHKKDGPKEIAVENCLRLVRHSNAKLSGIVLLSVFAEVEA